MYILLFTIHQGDLLHISNEAACFLRKFGGIVNDAVFDSWGDIMLGLYSLCGMSVWHLLKNSFCGWNVKITPKFRNSQTHECYQCIIANILKCSLSYIIILKAVFCYCKPCILNTTSSVPVVLHPQNVPKSAFLGKMILRKIIKITATKCHILRLKCTQFDFGCRSAPNAAGETYSAPPNPYNLIWGGLLRRRE